MLTLVTGNREKVREFERILGISLTHKHVELEEIQSVEFGPVVEKKAKLAQRAIDGPVLVEDTGIRIAAWNGLPGALTKWFVSTVGVEGLCRMLSAESNRRATAVTMLGYSNGAKPRLFVGEVRGTVLSQPKGNAGFGWDPIFRPLDSERTFAEMTTQEKDNFSMRKKALDAFRNSGLATF